MTFTPETEAEQVQRNTLTGCTDGVNRTEIRNVSEDIVWIIDGYHWTSVSRNPKVAYFRSTVARLSGSHLMTLEPGRTATLPARARVHLRLDPSVQSWWATYDALVNTAAEQGVNLVDEAVNKRRSVPALMYTCSRAGWETGKFLDRGRPDPDQQLRAAVFLDQSKNAREAGVNCAEQVTQVADDAKRTNRTPPVELARLQVRTRAGTNWSRQFGPVLKVAVTVGGKVITRGR